MESMSDTLVFFRHNAPWQTFSGTFMALSLITAFITGIYLFYLQRRNRRPGVKITAVQNIAWIYAAMFFITASLTYLPGLTDEAGNFAGLFKLDLIDDLLHFGSGVWAMLAAFISTRQSIIYFRAFGTVYLLDAVIGLLTQRGILDFGVWLYDFPNLGLAAVIGANIPHLLIGGVAVFTGFVLGAKHNQIETTVR